MNTIRSYVESPELPRTVAFFSLRRELAALTPPLAFWLGLAFGAAATLAGCIAAGYC